MWPVARVLIEEPPAMDMAQLHQAVAAELQLARAELDVAHEDTTAAPVFDLDAVAGGVVVAAGAAGVPSDSRGGVGGVGSERAAAGIPSARLGDDVMRDEIDSIPPTERGGMDVS